MRLMCRRWFPLAMIRVDRSHVSRPKSTWALVATLSLVLGFSGTLSSALGAEFDSARDAFISGKYQETIKACEKATRADEADDEWRLLHARALAAVGRYSNALEVVQGVVERSAWNIQARLLAREILLQNGQVDRATAMLQEINRLGGTRMWAYQDAPNLVTIGKAALLLGVDARRALEQFFDRAKKVDPKHRDVYLGSGQVALDKHDFDLAAKTFGEGLKQFPNDPDLHFGMAQAFAPSDRKSMLAAIQRVLELNPNHVPAHLLLADHLIDGEEYKGARESLDKAHGVNPWQPEAWAYRAVLAHLQNDLKAESEARDKALKFWPTNPQVDHLLGRKLSQKYRFAEGATRQRQALAFDPKYLPSRIQLAQDLLRLGVETEGWDLANNVHEQDGYDVTAFNLATLHDTMEKFTTLTNEHFVVRMGAKEAEIWGERALTFLSRARKALCAKYGFEVASPTIVEIFPDQKDFGVRTFGMPGNPGYLGVCFGSVITANSPSSQAGHPANWEAVLWHEFCHVVTLQLTKNKMPRWLSEGISVFEELQENPSWGQTMTPKYREMVLGKDFVPISELSAAFLAPKSDQHLQFAYYESYLVVDFLVKQFGLDAMKRILRELATGIEINAALAKHTAPMEKLEKDFAKFTRDRAEKLAPELDFDVPKRGELADRARREKDSKNFYVLTEQAKQLLKEKQWEQAKAPLQKLLKAYPGHTGSDDAYSLLATAHRGLNETNRELETLSRLAALDSDAVDTYLRVLELAEATKDWPTVSLNAERLLAVNPLIPQPYRFLALASEATGKRDMAITSYRTLLMLDPPDPAEAHFRLGRLLHQAGDVSAKRHVLQALEEAPRYRDAQRLLLEMSRASGGAKN